MTTPYINLSLPVVSTTVGPTWASNLNTAFELLDEHDHTSGKGVQIPSSGLNINADLNLNNFSLEGAESYKMTLQASPLSGASYANSVYSNNGDLYFVNSGGTGVQITSGGALNSTPTTFTAYTVEEVATNITIGVSDAFVFLNVDTTASRAITLPLSAAVATGRTYIIKDKSGSSRQFNITLNAAGSDTIDGSASVTLDSDYGVWVVTADGGTAWSLN